MKMIYTNFRSDEPVVTAEPCVADYVLELPPAQFDKLCRELNEDLPFLFECSGELVKDRHGINHCMLILCKGRDDGLLIKSEGYNHPRYHAYLAGARQIWQGEQHPSLREFNEKMVSIVDQYVKETLACQFDGKYNINLSKLHDKVDNMTLDDDLFALMLSERHEIELVDEDYDDIYIHVAPEYAVREDVSHLKKISPKDLDIMLAKHTLWLNGAGGERADFSDCLLENLDLSRKCLNYAILDRARVVDCDLFHTEMCFASCRDIQFHNCLASDILAEESDFHEAKFRSVELARSGLTHCNFTDASFYDCAFYNANMSYSCLKGTDFGTASLRSVDTEGCSYDEQAWLEERSNQDMVLPEVML